MPSQVKLLNREGEKIGYVWYNEKLNSPDNPDTHLGITTHKGEYALIFSDGVISYAQIVTEKEALDAILATGHKELLDLRQYSELKALINKVHKDEIDAKKKIYKEGNSYVIRVTAAEMDMLHVGPGDYIGVKFYRLDKINDNTSEN